MSPTLSPTPDHHHYSPYTLVMSDEFNVPGRSFADGSDPIWTAMDKNDYTNNALHYYSPSHAATTGGNLDIKTTAEKTTVVGFDDDKGESMKVSKNFKSAMLQSWNKFCFTGGIIEASVELPGSSDIGGLWPAFWILGNLARHTYVGSSSNIWPWSKTSCDPGKEDAQKISGCLNTQHFGMGKGVGRGAPEIDIFEVQPGNVKHNVRESLCTRDRREKRSVET
jgi:beta-glucanase (GH16 family)